MLPIVFYSLSLASIKIFYLAWYFPCCLPNPGSWHASFRGSRPLSNQITFSRQTKFWIKSHITHHHRPPTVRHNLPYLLPLLLLYITHHGERVERNHRPGSLRFNRGSRVYLCTERGESDGLEKFDTPNGGVYLYNVGPYAASTVKPTRCTLGIEFQKGIYRVKPTKPSQLHLPIRGWREVCGTYAETEEGVIIIESVSSFNIRSVL